MKDKHLLFGRDDTPNIVAIEIAKTSNDVIYQQFIRENGKVRTEYHKFQPYMYVNSEEETSLSKTRLTGNRKFNSIVYADTFKELYNEAKSLETSYIPKKQAQPLLQSGKTLFKEMKFGDVLRLYFDIEVYTPKEYNFPNWSRITDVITIISCYTNTGVEKLFRLDEYENEAEMISDFTRFVLRIDPDVMCGHNIFKFDLPYIEARAKLTGANFGIGRDGSVPHTFETSIKFADKSDSYTNFVCYGRHFIDTFFLAKFVDAIKRDMDSYNLKYLAKYLKENRNDRVEIPGDRIAAAWDNTDPEFSREDLCTYALDDVKDTEILDRRFGQSFFYASQFVPMSYQDVFRLGTETAITLIFLREYFYKQASIPEPEPERNYPGGFAGFKYIGHLGRKAIGIDIESQYPSLGDELNIEIPTDDLKIYKPILNLLKDLRVGYKTEMKKATDENIKNTYDALQSTYKVYLNTMSYGVLGSRSFMWNYYDGAELITRNGKNVLVSMMRGIVENGGDIIKWDTDGILCVYPEFFDGMEQIFLDQVQEHLNKEIKDGKVFQYRL